MHRSLVIFIISTATFSFAASRAQAVTCNVSDQIVQAQHLLEPVQVVAGTKLYRYTEQRLGHAVKFSEPEVQIALELLNPVSCALRQVLIVKRGAALIAPSGYTIEVAPRVNGIQWNYWATDYNVRSPEGWVVIANKYPLDDTMVIYTAFNSALGTPTLVQNGRAYLGDLASHAYDALREAGVPLSPVIKPEFVARLAPIEHMDLSEFLLDPMWTTARAYALLGANRERTSAYTCNTASACGLMQFTPGTYALMVKKYPKAALTKNFIDGARDPLNAMKAAFLLHEYNLTVFKQKLTAAQFASMLANPALLEESLSSAYNTGATRTLAVLQAYFAHPKQFTDWAQAQGVGSKAKLVTETKGYIAKLRFVRDSL